MPNTVTVNGVVQTDAVVTLTGVVLSPPPPPAGWIITANGKSHVDLPSLGGFVRLEVADGTPPDATGKWYLDGIPTSVTVTPWDWTAPANTSVSAKSYSFEVKVTSAGGSAMFGPATVTVAAATSGDIISVSLPWVSGSRVDASGIKLSSIVSCGFTTGNNSGGVPNMPFIRLSNASGTNNIHWKWALSETPGDLTGLPFAKASGVNSTGVNCAFAVDGPTPDPTYPVLKRNTRYYLNAQVDNDFGNVPPFTVSFDLNCGNAS